MADYYPLLERAVSSLPESTPEARRVIYERARKALLNQLRHVQPAVPESYINRENQALNLSIAQLEAALARADDAPIAGRPVAPRPPRALSAFVEPPRSTTSPRSAPAPELKAGPDGDQKSTAPHLPGATRDGEGAKQDADSGHADQDVALSPEDERRDGLESRRPVAIATPKSPPHPIKRVAILGAILLSATIAVAWLAIRLKDNPQDYARSRTPVSQEGQEAEEPAGKLIDRVGSDQTGRAGAPARPATSPAPASTPATAPAPEPELPVSQRAAILIEAPEDPQRVKTFVGSSVWRVDSSGDQPVLVADIVLPEAKLTVSMRMARNTDSKLPASHTIELRFAATAGEEPMGVAEIETPQMRIEDSANGAPLAGVSAAITPNYFLVGLSNGDKLASRNMDLMRERGWFDIPMVLTNGRNAKLTFEKGASGDRALLRVMQAWEKQ